MKIIAHRSGPRTYPEQTVASAKEALSLGADLIEIDLRFTKDGRLAVMHDESTERVFGSSKKVGELTAEEFCSLRHKNAPEYTGHVFEDYLKAEVAPLLIHIKESETIPAIIRALSEYNCLDRAVLGVTSAESVAVIRSIDRSIKILSFCSSDEIPTLIELKVDYIRLWEGWLKNAELVRKVKESSSELWVMSGNCDGYEVGEPSDDNLEKIIGYKPDGILINDVSRLKK